MSRFSQQPRLSKREADDDSDEDMEQTDEDDEEMLQLEELQALMSEDPVDIDGPDDLTPITYYINFNDNVKDFMSWEFPVKNVLG